MTDAKDYSHVWEARTADGNVYLSKDTNYGDIPPGINQFAVIPKRGLPVMQAFVVVLPVAPDKEDRPYRLIFRYLRTQNTQTNQMLPASFILGFERVTEENRAILDEIERGGPVLPKDFPPVKDGLRLHFQPGSCDMEIDGMFTMHPVAKDGIVTVYFGPLGEV